MQRKASSPSASHEVPTTRLHAVPTPHSSRSNNLKSVLYDLFISSFPSYRAAIFKPTRKEREISRLCKTELEFLKSLWGLGTEEEEGLRTGPPGYIGWRNSFLGIDSGAPYTFKNTGSGFWNGNKCRAILALEQRMNLRLILREMFQMHFLFQIKKSSICSIGNFLDSPAPVLCQIFSCFNPENKNQAQKYDH